MGITAPCSFSVLVGRIETSVEALRAQLCASGPLPVGARAQACQHVLVLRATLGNLRRVLARAAIPQSVVSLDEEPADSPS